MFHKHFECEGYAHIHHTQDCQEEPFSGVWYTGGPSGVAVKAGVWGILLVCVFSCHEKPNAGQSGLPRELGATWSQTRCTNHFNIWNSHGTEPSNCLK